MRRVMPALASVVAALVLAGGAWAHGVTVKIGHNRIEPEEVTVRQGGIVHFVNEDAMPGGHTLVADDGSFESPGLPKGGDWHHTFAEPGVYSYHIKEHPSANGRVIVEKAP